MSTLYLAEHKTLGTPAIIKALSPEMTDSREFRQRFQREAIILAQLNHPNIARLLDFFEENDTFYLIMEYIRGQNLAEILRQSKGPLPVITAVQWMNEILDALHYAHQKQVIHRDLKPANIMIDESRHVRLLDFGIALYPFESRITRTGETVGTLAYMSPEQFKTPRAIDRRSDLYACGMILYEMVTGRLPFNATSGYAMMQAHLHEAPPPPQNFNPDIPPVLNAAILKALAKKPDDRFTDAAAFSDTLQPLFSLLSSCTDPPIASKSSTKVQPDSIVSSGTTQTLTAHFNTTATLSRITMMMKRSLSREKILIAGASLILLMGSLGVFSLLRERETSPPSRAFTEPSPGTSPSNREKALISPSSTTGTSSSKEFTSSHFRISVSEQRRVALLNEARQNPGWILDYAARGDLAAVSLYLEAGVDINSRDHDARTPLWQAASNGHADVVAFLVSMGAQVDAVDEWGGHPAL